jgi:hypothetical protein
LKKINKICQRTTKGPLKLWVLGQPVKNVAMKFIVSATVSLRLKPLRDENYETEFRVLVPFHTGVWDGGIGQSEIVQICCHIILHTVVVNK